MVSESYIWTYRDSFYQFVLNPKNYVPGFILGVLYSYLMLFFTGLGDNPTLEVLGHILSITVLYMIGSLIWEYLRYRRLTPEQKRLHWDIDKSGLSLTDDQGKTSNIKWIRITRVKRNMAGYLLHRDHGDPIWVSINLFTPEQAEEFEDFLYDMLGENLKRS